MDDEEIRGGTRDRAVRDHRRRAGDGLPNRHLEAGAQTGFRAPGVTIEVSQGSFNVERILMHETCTSPGQTTFHDFGGFQQGANATLTGTISRSGKLSGIYNDGHGGFTRVAGHIRGHGLTVSGKEFSYYTPPDSSVKYACHASGKFDPRRV